ncbi:hypothetical protein HDU98_001607 [Podochytrium sp. JEL0797]|nr:hypothetical protein HDU98_001607 [Podochytrium sp. JEL0797]
MSLSLFPRDTSLFSRDPFFRDLGAFNAWPFEEPTGDASQMTTTTGGRNWPRQFRARVDMSETDKGYMVHVDLPGVKKEEVQISIKDQVLTVSGERESETKDEQRLLSERSCRKFARSIRLPDDADADKVAAKMDHAVLELTFEEKPAHAGVKKIAVQ